MVLPELEIDRLTPEERLELIERLWDSLSSDQVDLTSAQQAELDRRLDDLDARPEAAMSWDEALRRLRERTK